MQLVQCRPNLGERVRELGHDGSDSLAFTREFDARVDQLGDVRVREWGHRMRPTHRFDLVRSQHAEIIACRTYVRKPALKPTCLTSLGEVLTCPSAPPANLHSPPWQAHHGLRSRYAAPDQLPDLKQLAAVQHDGQRTRPELAGGLETGDAVAPGSAFKSYGAVNFTRSVNPRWCNG